MFTVVEKKKKSTNLFGYREPDFSTEGIKYMGSKKEIMPHIWSKIKDLNIETAIDGFAGSTRVSQFFHNNNISTLCNDLNIRSYCFGHCYLMNQTDRSSLYIKQIEYLNNLPGVYGYYSQEYGGSDNNGSSIQKDGKKKLRQLHNTMKLDAIREKIDEIAVDEINKYTLITSLINALDRVDSTLGHFSSYLKDRSARSYQTMELKLPNIIYNNNSNIITQKDIFGIIDQKYDLAYYDPPYGSNNNKMPSSRVRYGQYYHIRESIVRNDKPETVGAINKRADATVEKTYSIFEDYTKVDNIFVAEKALLEMITKSKSKHILLSYNTNGRARIEFLRYYLESAGYDFEIAEIGYKKNVMAGMKRTHERDNLGDKSNAEILLFVHNC